MKVVQINITCQNGSTGKICAAVSELLTQKSIENYILFNSGASTLSNAFKYTDKTRVNFAALSSRILGNWGFEGKGSTRRLIGYLDQLRPDVLHLHNLHSHACDLGMLFSWIHRHRVKVFWTIHDCWPFTGYCMHYEMIGCEKWKTGCGGCPQRKEYSWFFDRSEALFRKKKALTRDLDMTLIAPSQWTANQIQSSFLGDYPVKVIYNGVDLNAFSPTESALRQRFRLEKKKIVLGVAFGWGKKKGLDVFIELSQKLGDDYRIVMVGTDDKLDAALTESITSIHRTENRHELAALYTTADVFVNPTREEVLGLTNLEALACGTPVITFDSGGSPETVDKDCGVVVPKDDIELLIKEIRRVCETHPFSAQACIDRARRFEIRERFQDYIRLYEESAL